MHAQRSCNFHQLRCSLPAAISDQDDFVGLYRLVSQAANGEVLLHHITAAPICRFVPSGLHDTTDITLDLLHRVSDRHDAVAAHQNKPWLGLAWLGLAWLGLAVWLYITSVLAVAGEVMP